MARQGIAQWQPKEVLFPGMGSSCCIHPTGIGRRNGRDWVSNAVTLSNKTLKIANELKCHRSDKEID